MFGSLASSKFFGSGLQSVFGFGMRYLHYSNLSPVNRFSVRWLDLGLFRILDSALRFFSGLLDLRVFRGFLDLGFSGFGFRFFQGLDCFRLLIQRCKRWGGIGNLFDKGMVLPDEIKISPTNEFWKRAGTRRKWAKFYRIFRRAVTSSLWPFPIGI